MEATGLKIWLAVEEDRPHTRSSPPGETAEAPPRKHRDKPSSHTNLAGCGGDTERDILKVCCGKLVTKGNEGISTSCKLELVEEVLL